MRIKDAVYTKQVYDLFDTFSQRNIYIECIYEK